MTYSTDLATPLEHESIRHPLAARRLTVAGVSDLTQRLRRVTLEGDLADFTSPGPGDHVKVFFPNPETGVLNAPRMTQSGIERDPQLTYLSRDYTPMLRADGRIDLDFVLHSHGGPAVQWATTATEGDELVVAGPRGSKLVPRGAGWYVIGGDETALPAISRWLGELGPDALVQVFIEVQDAADESYPLPSGHDITWLHRGTAPTGTTELLAEAVRDLGAPQGPGYYWFAGEAGSLKPLRRHLRRELGLDKSWVTVDGYWKRGTAEHDHHAPVDPEDPA